jgi:hypothetical protein
MAEIIQAIFCEPPIVIARLGGSSTPAVAYSWIASPYPRNEGDTVIEPAWSLDVMPDGSVRPFVPDEIRFRDGDQIRPVCPFIEVWALLGEAGSEAEGWRAAPLTESLLRRFGADRSAVTFSIDARNAKAARRAQNPALVYGVFPTVQLRGDQHTPIALSAGSPPGVDRPMIPHNRQILMGSVQVIRPTPNPAGGPEPSGIDLDVVRIRFTPAHGEFYGPPQAASPTPESPVPAVKPENAFLDPQAGWFNSPALGGGFVEPQDTYDFFQLGGKTPSLGVVDDTCEARIDVTLRLTSASARALSAHANVLVGPPDFGPDRRPFLSIADDLNDRFADASDRSAAMSPQDIDRWVEDLFERTYETASLMNVDHWRREHGRDPLPADQLRAHPIAGDGISSPEKAMGSRDKRRNERYQIAAPSDDIALPLAAHARERHRSMSDLQRLKELVQENPDRIPNLVRGPFEHEPGESSESAQEWTSMRMPPFMRHSNANPLTLAAWQYDLLMKWVAQVGAPSLVSGEPPVVAAAVPRPLSDRAAKRRDEVLKRLT